MAYATEGKMATSRRHSIPTHNTTWLLTRRSSGNSLKNHLQPHGECQDDQSGGSRRSRVDEGDNTLTYIAQFNYVAQKSIDLSFSKGNSPSRVVSIHVASGMHDQTGDKLVSCSTMLTSTIMAGQPGCLSQCVHSVPAIIHKGQSYL